MPAIISAGLVIDLITEEHQQQTLDTLRSTPADLLDIVCGKITACIILIPAESGLWLLLLTLNGIRISSLPEILLHVTFTSAALILIATLFALHYMDRTKAQFVFSTAAVILLLLALSFPHNPLNLIALLAAGSPVPLHWIVLLGWVFLCMVLVILVRNSVRKLSLL
jgi:ABC-type Na+ efflux pump permease subunit